MNAPIKPALLSAAVPPDATQPAAPSGSRYIWEGKFGSMVIEIVDGVAYVNGEAVEPMWALDVYVADVSSRSGAARARSPRSCC
ncbi:MAG: hypothetical protein EPO01_21390 [Aquabacterium sp.]|nr:MAG: hypothetical protein EPO12_13620 [Aquabacterium sp.]TAL13486.1 MAG: hypothetical protein EPO01_21390 [Aquabacterium sp.]